MRREARAGGQPAALLAQVGKAHQRADEVVFGRQLERIDAGLHECASEGSQSGVNVQLLQAPASTQTGLVRVSIPRGESTFVFSVPKDVYAGEGQSALAASTIRMENGSPVPAWIKHDPQSMSVSACRCACC